MSNLLDIKSLSKDEISTLIKRAEEFKAGKKSDKIKEKVLALMFFENSTRTKCSFELAAKKLGMNVLNFDLAHSSFNKGESIKDTLETLYFMGVNGIIIRHSKNGIFSEINKTLKYPLNIINAGEGTLNHPTQALLDYMTMKEKINNVENKKIIIIGDIAHSRVANSNFELLKKFGADLQICTPEYFKPEKLEEIKHFSDINCIENADVIMLLRIQKERFDEKIPYNEYIKNYQLNSKLIKKLAPNAIIMHPGPVNREIEISSELLDSKRGKTILEQVSNGVFIRMAVLEKFFGEKNDF